MTLAADSNAKSNSAELNVSVDRWPMTIVVEPGVCIGHTGAIIFEPVQNKRYRLCSNELACLIAAGQVPNSLFNIETVPGYRQSGIENGWSEWRDHEWVPSIDFYLSSRRIHAIDRNDHTKGHATAINQYLLDGPLPTQEPPSGSSIKLPKPIMPPGTESLGELAVARRTTRVFKRQPVPIAHVSGWLAAGFADIRDAQRAVNCADPSSFMRSHGSAFDFYLVVYHVENLRAGVYWYNMIDHSLTLVAEGSFRAEMKHGLCGQNAPMSAAWTLVMASDFARYQWRYRHDKALRNLYTDAGWVAQTLILVGAGYGLGAMTTPATRDSKLMELLHLEPLIWAPVYTVTFGLLPKPRSTR